MCVCSVAIIDRFDDWEISISRLILILLITRGNYIVYNEQVTPQIYREKKHQVVNARCKSLSRKSEKTMESPPPRKTLSMVHCTSRL